MIEYGPAKPSRPGRLRPLSTPNLPAKIIPTKNDSINRHTTIKQTTCNNNNSSTNDDNHTNNITYPDQDSSTRNITSGKSPTDTRIPSLKIEILLDSDPLRSRILVRRLAVPACLPTYPECQPSSCSSSMRHLLGWLRPGWLKMP